MEVEAIEPHGMCAGVRAAVALALRQADAYCLGELVHSEIVLDDLRRRGYSFAERVEDVPDGATVVVPAHGVAPEVREQALRRGMKVVDATCPSVAKVHSAARDLAAKGLVVVVIGDPEHAEVRGIAGELSGAEFKIWDCRGHARARDLGLTPSCRVGVVAQTTLDAADVERRVAELRALHEVVSAAEVCRATRERQDAVRAFCGRAAAEGVAPAVLVLGSRTSSNSRRLVEVAASCGARAFMAGTAEELKGIDFGGVARLGVTSGASTPESLFEEAVAHLRGMQW